jgi:dicarboxylate/amino acid:cation (Na+ or H+) symporter, DAACS family
MVSHRKMIAALILGAGVGIVANLAAGGAPWLDAVIRNFAQPLGQLFIRLLFMLVIPLLFSALVLGVADLELRHLGRLGARMLGYTVIVSGISVLIGVALVNLRRCPPEKGSPPSCWRSCRTIRSRPPRRAT